METIRSNTTATAPAPTPVALRVTVEDVLRSRHSVRAFLPTPVPRSTVERLLSLAARSASNSNCQPWQVHVVTGAAKRSLTAALLRAHAGDDEGRGRDYPYQPEQDGWCEPFRSRRRRFGESLYRDTLGIRADDPGARLDHHRRNYDFFGAPVGIVLTTSRHPLQSALVDAGLFLQALMLAARGNGLDTCPQASVIDFSPVLRRHLLIPDDQLIVCGVALGYADPAHPLNHLRTTREPVGSFATFHGDEAD
ncbi:Chloronitrobenzene nitroreductase [Streptomyces sp. RB17]|uniref:nitroreductase n=1 Tax=Streptomyces sp. RB17 TaxID=2585197 RepID=UPI00129744DA|nr:nitroreductase [Streptomyces sp. RB17]MQY40206.1 Chloronitrobenzene nitroreductase [Streptomyces sp. RB17]